MAEKEAEQVGPRKGSIEKLAPYAKRSAAVAAGTDTYTAGDIQQILALLVRLQDPGAAG